MATDNGTERCLAADSGGKVASSRVSSMDRQPMDIEAYEERAHNGPCFVCAFLQGHPDYRHETVLEDDDHIAFLDRYPTLPGKLLACPKRHVEHAVRDLDDTEYVNLMLFVRTAAQALEAAMPVERTYIYTLGSQQGNSHLHWHIAGLPPGVPYHEQQFAALMSGDGVLTGPGYDTVAIARRIRAAVEANAAIRRP